jgi:hypothetical protein
MKIRQVEVELFHRTDRQDMTKLIVPFRNFWNSPRSYCNINVLMTITWKLTNKSYHCHYSVSLFIFCCWLHLVVDLRTVYPTQTVVLFIMYPYAKSNISVRHQ